MGSRGFELNDEVISTDIFVADASVSTRASFLVKTYLHLLGAIAAFILLEATALVLFADSVKPLMEIMVRTPVSWLVVLGLFMGASWIAEVWANNATNKVMQYIGLGLYVVAEAIIFLPILFIASNYYDGVILMAGGSTVALTLVLTAVVFITRKDFSFLRSVLIFGGIAAMGAIVIGAFCGPVGGFISGPVFTYLMIAFACCAILYDTSNIMLNYRTDQYIAASLSLFASVALLFWYMLRLYMAFQRD